jgi:hypothetical protein
VGAVWKLIVQQFDGTWQFGLQLRLVCCGVLLHSLPLCLSYALYCAVGCDCGWV